MKQSKVSVIVTTRNNEKTIDDCLSSITKQSWKELELVVVDNNSTDKTKEMAGKYTDKVFNIGPERCTQRNYGAKVSAGEYLCFIDSDMKLSTAVIEECVQSIESDDDVVGVTIPEESFGVGFWSACKKLERSFYLNVPWMQAARFFPKSKFDQVGGYDEKLVSGEDWELSQRIGALGKIKMIKSFIYHNEGKITLMKTLKKKYYYATKFSAYTQKKEEHDAYISKQTSALSRYVLFFSDPLRLFANPIVGLGMLFMKTAEFAMGAAGLIVAKLNKNEK